MVQFYQRRSPRQLRRLPCCAPSASRKSPQRTARAAILPGGRLAVTLTTWRPLPVVARVSCRQHTPCAADLGRQRRTTTCPLCVTVWVLTHSATPTRTLGPSPAPLECLLLLDLRRLLPPPPPSAALRSRQLNLGITPDRPSNPSWQAPTAGSTFHGSTRPLATSQRTRSPPGEQRHKPCLGGTKRAPPWPLRLHSPPNCSSRPCASTQPLTVPLLLPPSLRPGLACRATLKSTLAGLAGNRQTPTATSRQRPKKSFFRSTGA